MRKTLLGATALLLACHGPADAEWLKASSRHFIIYADSSPEQLRSFANKVERFDKAARVSRSMSDPEVGDGNRLTLFVVRDVAAVQSLMRDHNRTAAGFYKPRASGSVAVVPRSTRGGKAEPDAIFSMNMRII